MSGEGYKINRSRSDRHQEQMLSHSILALPNLYLTNKISNLWQMMDNLLHIILDYQNISAQTYQIPLAFLPELHMTCAERWEVKWQTHHKQPFNQAVGWSSKVLGGKPCESEWLFGGRSVGKFDMQITAPLRLRGRGSQVQDKVSGRNSTPLSSISHPDMVRLQLLLYVPAGMELLKCWDGPFKRGRAGKRTLSPARSHTFSSIPTCQVSGYGSSGISS